MNEKDTKIDEVVNELRERIQKGIYVAQQRLPAERDIAKEFGVSRITVHAGLLRLQSENLVDIIPRAGATVRATGMKITVGAPIAESGELKYFGSFIRAMEAQGRKSIVRFIIPSSIENIDEEQSNTMKLQAGTKVLRRYRVHITEGIPYRILDSYYLATLTSELLGKDEGYIPLFKWLHDIKGIQAKKAVERLNARMPNQEEAKILNIGRNQPVIDMDRWVWDAHDTIFEYSHIVANAALHEYVYDYAIEEEASK